MVSDKLLPAIGICLVMCGAISGQEVAQTDFARHFAELEGTPAVAQEVRPAAYFQSPSQAQPVNYGPPPGPPTAYGQGPVMAYPCPPEPVCRSGWWRVGIDVIPTQFHLTDSQFGPWPHDDGTAARLNLGYEHADGFGIRGRLWAFGDDASPPLTDVEVAASTFNLDLYKRISPGEGELVLGAGSVGSVLQFELPDGTESRFRGGGISVFADGYYPLVHFQKSALGAVGRGRISLLSGEWTDSTGTVVPPTDHDALNILEAGFGLEFRRRFGPLEDKYWYVAITHEMQRWDSPWMGEFLDSSAGFDGLNINFGLAW